MRRARWAWGLMLVGCAAAPAVRSRAALPSPGEVDAALEAVEPRARRCLAAGERVSVEGFFDGRSGQYLVEQVAAESASVRAQQCVSLALERARVRPFDSERVGVGSEVSAGGAGDAGAAAGSSAALAPEAVAGEVDPAAVVALLRAEEPEARRCYEDALRGDARLRGRVEVRFTLSVDGRVTHAVTSGPPGFRAVGHCIVGHLRGLQWPAARGGPVDFVFPYAFAPAGSGR